MWFYTIGYVALAVAIYAVMTATRPYLSDNFKRGAWMVVLVALVVTIGSFAKAMLE
jgi:hypothetical protein